MRIVDVEGKQVPDIVCFNLKDPEEKLSCNNSRLIQKRWIFSTGHILYSDEGNEMLTIVGDTVGIHHASGGCCNEPANFRRYGQHGTRNCRENLMLASKPLHLTEKDIPGAFCPFMKVIQHDDGRYEIEEPTSKPGDYIDLRADMDLFVAISNCPQDKNPCNGFNPPAEGRGLYAVIGAPNRSARSCRRCGGGNGSGAPRDRCGGARKHRGCLRWNRL